MFYATVIYKDEQATKCNQFRTEVGVNDLHRFESRKDRDSFVDENNYAEPITRKEAEIEYKEQFKY